MQGVSSGATMAMKLIAKLHERAQAADRGQWTLRVAGIIAEESAPLDFGAADDRGRLRFPYPPTIFVGMEVGGAGLLVMQRCLHAGSAHAVATRSFLCHLSSQP